MELPSNRQISQMTTEAERCLEETKRKEKGLTPEGKEIIDVTERLLEDTQRLFEEKNPDDLLQRIIDEARKGSEALQENHQRWRKLQQALNQFDTQELKNKLTRFYDLSKLVSIELITSAEFRQSIYDFFSVLYAILVDASHIERIGQPLREAIEAAKQQAKPLLQQGKGKAKETLGQAMGDKRMEAEGTSEKRQGKVERKTQPDKSQEVLEKLKEAGEQAVQRGLDYADPDKRTFEITDEHINQLLDQLNKVLGTISKRERSQRAFRALIDAWDILRDASLNFFYTAEDAATTLNERERKHFEEALCLSQELMEHVTGRRLDILISHLKVVSKAISEDEELRTYVRRFGEFIDSTIKDPQSLTTQPTRDELQRYIRRGRDLFYKAEGLQANFKVLMDEFNEMIYALEDDPLNQAIQRDIQRLTSLILLDNRGNVTFKPQVLDQLRIIVTSLIVNRMRFPLPPLTFDDGETLGFTVTGMVLNIHDLIPSRIVAQNHGLAIVDMKTPEHPALTHASETVRVVLRNIKIHLPNAYIQFDHRTFPKVKDEGFANIEIGGDGMDLGLLLRGSVGTNRWFTLARTECLIHDLSIKFEGTHHDTIYNAFLTLFKPRIKAHIESAIQESMISVFERLNDQIEEQVKKMQLQLGDVTETLKEKISEAGSVLTEKIIGH